MPPDTNSVALLNPSDIIISNSKQSKISAQNILKGSITNMTVSGEFRKVEVEILVHGILLRCNVTNHAVKELHLIPGKKVWVIFKASSLQWQ